MSIRGKFVFLYIAFIFLFGLMPLSAVFAQEQSNSFRLELSLVKSQIVLGEPIIMHYKLTNKAQAGTILDLGRHQDDWITVKVVDRAFNQAPPVPDRRPPINPYWPGIRPIVRSSSQQILEGDIVLSQWVLLRHAGNYSVIVEARIPYDRHWLHPVPKNAEDRIAVEDQQTLPLIVTPYSTTKLRKIAEMWYQQAMKGPEYRAQKTAMKALFSMPDLIVLPFWRELLSEKELALDEAVDQLVRLGTQTAASLLTEMIANPLLSKERHVLASNGHDEIYRANAPGMRTYLENLYRTYGESTVFFDFIRYEEAQQAAQH